MSISSSYSSDLRSQTFGHPFSTSSFSPRSDITSSSSSVGGMLRRILHLDGRSSSSSSNEISTERQRLEIMDMIHNTLLNPYAAQAVHNHLTGVHTREGRRSRVLDVGTGTGSWALDVGAKQPYCDVIAADIDWSNFGSPVVRNGNVDCVSADVRGPLPWPPATFDIIHVKALLLDVPSYHTVMQRLGMLLRPGGVMIMVEAEPIYYVSGGLPGSTSLQTWNACVRDAYAAKGVNVTMPRDLGDILGQCGIFQPNIATTEAGMPTAGYMKGSSTTLAKAGRLHRSVIEANIRSLLPVVLEHGYDPNQIASLIGDVLQELTSTSSTHYQRLFSVVARRR